MPVMLAAVGSPVEQRLLALERELRKVSVVADGALQIPPQMRGATPGSMVSGGRSVLDLGGLSQVMTVLVNGGTQTGGSIAGVAGPPLGLSGVNGEVVLTTATFSLPRQQLVMILAICTDYVSVAAGPLIAAAPVYFQVDGTDNSSAYGYLPVYAAADPSIRALTTTILLVTTLAAGSHTVKVIWNSQEAANDTIVTSNNPLFVFQLGATANP